MASMEAAKNGHTATLANGNKNIRSMSVAWFPIKLSEDYLLSNTSALKRKKLEARHTSNENTLTIAQINDATFILISCDRKMPQ